MNVIQKVVVAVGRVLGTVLGQDFDTPATEVMEKYPNLPYGR